MRTRYWSGSVAIVGGDAFAVVCGYAGADATDLRGSMVRE